MRRFKRLRVVFVALLTLLMIAPAVYGGVRWTGIDPVLDVNGNQINILVKWPAGQTCAIDGIQVEVRVPKGVAASVVSESEGDPDGSGCVVSTETEVENQGGSNKMFVSTEVDADGQFPVEVEISVNGSLVATHSGSSKGVVTGVPVDLP